MEKEYAIVYSYDPIGTNGTIRFFQIWSGEQARQKLVLVLEYQSLKLAKIKCGLLVLTIIIILLEIHSFYYFWTFIINFRTPEITSKSQNSRSEIWTFSFGPEIPNRGWKPQYWEGVQ